MKIILSATATFIILATPALAVDASPSQPMIQQVRDSSTEVAECSKQVWPHFSDACLRSKGKGVSVRVVTTERR
jgi:hypothetical protein